MFLGPIAGSMLTTVVVAPFVEEFGKFTSIKKNKSGIYYVVFNIIEFSKLVTKGASPLSRIPALVIHLITTIVQKKGIDKASEEKDSAKRSEKEKKAYLKGVMIHGIFNAFLTVGSIKL